MSVTSLFVNVIISQVEVGSTLRLDCPVTQLTQLGAGASVMLWKKGHRVLTAGSIKVSYITCLKARLPSVGLCSRSGEIPACLYWALTSPSPGWASMMVASTGQSLT